MEAAGRANCCFSALDWCSFGKREDYNYGNKPFTGPEKQTYWPRPEANAIYMSNFRAVKECGLDPRQCATKAVTTKSGRTVPPHCLEACLSLETGDMIFLNPEYRSKYIKDETSSSADAAGDRVRSSG